MAAQSNDAQAQRMYLPDPAKLNLLPDGAATIINRPLAIQYEIPGRGNTPHQIDNDVKTDDFSPSPHDGPIDTLPDPDTIHGKDIYSELIPPRPVPVVIVPKPYRTTLKQTFMMILYPNGFASGADVGTIDIVNRQQLVGADNTRASVTVVSAASQSVDVAVSSDPSFNSYVLVRDGVSMTFMGQNALYVAPYVNTTDTALTVAITAYAEVETSLDANP